MTHTINRPWECSSSFEQFYAEKRSHVADLLAEWGSRNNTMWPANARVSDLSMVTMTPSWFMQIVMLGRTGIHHSLHGNQLHELFPQQGFGNRSYDCWYTERIDGNIQHGHQRSLVAYIPLDHQVMVIRLGCHHPSAQLISDELNVRTYQCPSCKTKWGEDYGD